MRIRPRMDRGITNFQHGFYVGLWAIMGFLAGRRACARSGTTPAWWLDAASVLMGLVMGAVAFGLFVGFLLLVSLILRTGDSTVRRLIRWTRR